MPDIKVLDSSFIKKLGDEYGSSEVVAWIVDDTDALHNILMAKRRISMISNHPVHVIHQMNKFYKDYC